VHNMDNGGLKDRMDQQGLTGRPSLIRQDLPGMSNLKRMGGENPDA
jgi:hypothetical protein